MRIWIDADAAPRDVKDIVFRAAKRLELETILVANRTMAIPPNSPTIAAVTVRDGANLADKYIAQHATQGDLAITADIPLAAELVAKQVVVIDPHGEEYHADNIGSRLSMRNFMDEMRGAGTISGGGRPYGELDKKAFASSFDRLVTRLLKQAGRL